MSAAEVLRRIWLFSGLSQDQLDAISSFTFRATFSPGELIVEEGRTGNRCYVIMAGEVEVVKGLGAESQRVLARRGSGEVFGEMALLGEWPRTASIRALNEVGCLGIDRWVFLTQLERHHRWGLGCYKSSRTGYATPTNGLYSDLRLSMDVKIR